MRVVFGKAQKITTEPRKIWCSDCLLFWGAFVFVLLVSAFPKQYVMLIIISVAFVSSL